MKLAIFGATGRIGRLLLMQALDGGHNVTAYARREGWADAVSSPHLRAITGPLDRQHVEATLAGSDAVIVTLAAGSGTLERFDSLALPVLERDGPRRIVSLVGASVRMPGDPQTFSLSLMSLMMHLVPTGVLADARAHADALARSTLDWTLVRAANFADRTPTGKVRAERSFPMTLGASVTRTDLAAFMLTCATAGHFVRMAPMVANSD